MAILEALPKITGWLSPSAVFFSLVLTLAVVRNPPPQFLQDSINEV